MLTALSILIGSQLIGEALRQVLHLPLPGPVLGMFVLAVALVVRGGARHVPKEAAPPPLVETANALISNLGLLFVPAGVGVIAELGVLRQEWLPVMAGLLVSTALSLVVTGLVMHRLSTPVETDQRTPPFPADRQGAR
jgi:holin-like protein